MLIVLKIISAVFRSLNSIPTPPLHVQLQSVVLMEIGCGQTWLRLERRPHGLRADPECSQERCKGHGSCTWRQSRGLRDASTRQGGPRTAGSARRSERGAALALPQTSINEHFHFHRLWALQLGAQGGYAFTGIKVGMTQQKLGAHGCCCPQRTSHVCFISG